MRQRPRPAVPDDAAVVEDFLELGGGFLTLSGGHVCLSADVSGIEAGKVCDKENLPVLDGRYGRLQARNRGSRIPSVQRQLRASRGQPESLHLRVERVALIQVLCE